MIDIQEFLLEATRTIAKEKIDRTQFTKSYTCKVVSIEQDYTCTVSLSHGFDVKAIIPLSMRQFVNKGDIVVVQDLYSNGVERLIHGVVNFYETENKGIHVYNPVTNEVVSSVFQVYNIMTKQVVSDKIKV